MDAWTDRLSEYLDGDLTPVERQQLEEHLAGCAECRDTFDALAQIVRLAAALPERQPPRDLWAAVADGIGAAPPAMTATGLPPAAGSSAQRRIGAPMPAARRLPSRVFRFTGAQLAAAAAGVMLVTAAAVWLLASGSPPASRFAADDGSDAIAPAGDGHGAVVLTAAGVEARHAAAIAELEAALDAAQGVLDPATTAVLEMSLATIDSALEDARGALAADPGSAFIARHLENTLQRKVELLRSASRLPLRT